MRSLARTLLAALLGLECASSNDQSFSNSDMRRTARTMLQFMPGTDFIFSGYAAEPNYDNMFAGSNFDAEDFDDYNVMQRDMQVDGRSSPCYRGRCDPCAPHCRQGGSGRVQISWFN